LAPFRIKQDRIDDRSDEWEKSNHDNDTSVNKSTFSSFHDEYYSFRVTAQSPRTIIIISFY